MLDTEIIVRNLQFPLGSVPREWIPERPAVARFLDQLSLVFPRGERFFIDALRKYEERLSPKLRADVRRFVQQEALHGREHEEHNRRLGEQGFPVAIVDAEVAREIEYLKTWPARRQVAYTAAIEHFTALLGQRALEDEEDIFEGAHPTMAALWRWHAAEENEHAAVAFDVYREIGGTYRERILVMLIATVRFWGLVARRIPLAQQRDGKAAPLGAYLQLANFFFGRPGVFRRSLGAYLSYFRPSFHPRELDTSHLVTRWRAQFEQLSVYTESVRTKAA